jgi:hypothetical protein
MPVSVSLLSWTLRTISAKAELVSATPSMPVLRDIPDMLLTCDLDMMLFPLPHMREQHQDMAGVPAIPGY